MGKLQMPKLAFYVTLRCNLKCKLCAVYAPYYENPFHPDKEFLTACVDRYFELVEHVELFSVSGGEPMLRNDLAELVRHMHGYSDRIGRFEIITNGTIIPTDALLDSLRMFGNKLKLLVDDYGPDKSINAKQVAARFREIDGATVILRDYHSADMHCGGWVDYGISETSVRKSNDAAKSLFSKCSYPQKLDFCTSMVGGKLYSCTQLRRLVDLGMIEANPHEVFDLFDSSISNETIQQNIQNLYSVKYLSACAYCNGICDDSKRYQAAEQLVKNN